MDLDERARLATIIRLRETAAFPYLHADRAGRVLAVHAVLAHDPLCRPEGFNRIFEDTPLEVILVNAKSPDAPDKAQAIANQPTAGGGDAAKGRATSPAAFGP